MRLSFTVSDCRKTQIFYSPVFNAPVDGLTVGFIYKQRRLGSKTRIMALPEPDAKYIE